MKVNKEKFLFRLLLVSLLGLFSVLILKQKNAPFIQLCLILAAISLYLIWAFIYHYKDKSLTLGIYLEYLLTAALALIVMLGLFL